MKSWPAVATFPWAQYAQPQGNGPNEVGNALESLRSCTRENEDDAYNRFLFAIGNNHAGTYFPVAVPTIGFLGETLLESSPSASEQALNVLVDLLGSFWPDPAFESIETADGPKLLTQLVLEAAQTLLPKLESLRAIGGTERQRLLAAEVLGLINNPKPCSHEE
jgi:hypothetical protein